MLTHYTREGSIDWSRTEAHLNFMRPWVNGFLFAGPTGDGDTPAFDTRQQLVQWANDRLKPRKEFLLAGTALVDNGSHMPEASIQSDDKPTSCVGLFVQVTDASTTAVMEKQLTALLEQDTPVTVALQSATPASDVVTLIASLATRYQNLICIGDATNEHQLARHQNLPAGVFRFRTAEGDYTRQLASNGGPCHGLLLSCTNHFPQAFHDLTLAPAQGKWDESHAMSKRLTALLSDAAALVQNHADMKKFDKQLAKAIDHHMAYGPGALTAPPSFMQDAMPVDTALLTAVGEVLTRHGFQPETGYFK